MNKHLRTEQFDIDSFQEYVATYTERHPDNHNTMFLDMLYGIGLAIDPDKFNGADGFKKFIEWISEAQRLDDDERFMNQMMEEERQRDVEIMNHNTNLLSELEKEAGKKYIEDIMECLKESEAHGKLEIVKSKSDIHKHIHKLKQPQESDSFDHIYVDQYVNGGMSGDEFAGFIYIPLPKGKFLKSHYSM